MFTCDDENVPSWKIIEALGAKLSEKRWDEERRRWSRFYWLPL